MNLEFGWFPGCFARADPGLLEECAALYSNHYGTWSAQAPPPGSPGSPVRLSAARLKRWFDSDDSRIAVARAGSELVGYAIAGQMKAPRCGVVSWVTQLVVHESYRRRNVGKRLLFSIWGMSNHYAWGLVTANPYAVRALEKATRRRCRPARIKRSNRRLHRLGCEHVGYVNEQTEVDVGPGRSRIRTDFFLDHSDLGEMIAQARSDDKPWLLGSLPEGWEWFAFTFSDQDQIRLSSTEIATMLEASDQITRQAYARMTLDHDHRWARHTAKESREIIEYCRLEPGQAVLDFGCGTGRHAIELAASGVRVTGVDYVGEFVAKAASRAQQLGVPGSRFVNADCRDVQLCEVFDAAVCLYDVVGTYADLESNTRMLANLAHHLKPGGFALVSVMNLALTKRRATRVFSITDEPDNLLKLPPSNTMETTGDIFDPAYYMLDEESNVVYRKEQFTRGSDLPTELIVRDRRFSADEITTLCSDAGLEVVWTRPVRAGRWERRLDELDDRAKEILVLCRKLPRGGPERSAAVHGP